METRSNYVMVGARDRGAARSARCCSSSGSPGSRTRRPSATTSTSAAVGGLNKGSNVSFSGVPVGQVDEDFAASQPARVRLGADRGRSARRRCSKGTTAQINSVSFTGVNEIQLERRRARRPPITQLGPQGCPVVPASAGGLGALLNSAPELMDAHPAPDRAADRAAQRQEPELDRRHPREYRRDHQGASPTARRRWPTRIAEVRIAVAQRRRRREQHRRRCRTTPTGW